MTFKINVIVLSVVLQNERKKRSWPLLFFLSFVVANCWSCYFIASYSIVHLLFCLNYGEWKNQPSLTPNTSTLRSSHARSSRSSEGSKDKARARNVQWRHGAKRPYDLLVRVTFRSRSRSRSRHQTGSTGKTKNKCVRKKNSWSWWRQNNLLLLLLLRK